MVIEDLYETKEKNFTGRVNDKYFTNYETSKGNARKDGRSSKESYSQLYPKDLVKTCEKILKKPKKYTSKEVAPIINEIFKY